MSSGHPVSNSTQLSGVLATLQSKPRVSLMDVPDAIPHLHPLILIQPRPSFSKMFTSKTSISGLELRHT
ncbi:hypothetical protein BJV78DRAFT_1202885 [Lactifluus subvellereus]|nr:hypothetical protein BJV78DRAFT_1202885 [Lactifluus subvellereus]